MVTGNAENAVLWPLAVYFVLVIGLLVFMVAFSYVLGERHKERATGVPYESGVSSTGTARIRFDVKFYLVAMFFVIFDVEAVFIFAWAITLREAGWSGYIEILIFIGVLLAALVYLWKLGALDWGPSGRKIEQKD